MNRELNEKIGRVRTVMASKGLDAIFIKRQDNFAWLTCGGRNYVGMGETGNCGLLVTRDRLYAITNNIEEPRMREEEHLEKMGFEIRYGLWHDTGFEKRAISEIVGDGRVGYDTSDVSDDIKLLRFDLTPEEIERYRQIGYDASEAMESVALGLKKGMSEYEIAGLIMSAMEKKGLEILSCMVAADERISSYRHPLPTNKTVEKKVQLGGNFRRSGLVICMTRYVYFEEPSEELRCQYRANQEIDCTYIANSIPGKSFTYPLQKGREAYASRGYGSEFDKHHQGGPIGYAGRDYRVDFNTPGTIGSHQAFCWNPSITGTKSEDTYVCTADECIAITRPVLFPSVEIEVEGRKFSRADILVIK